MLRILLLVVVLIVIPASIIFASLYASGELVTTTDFSYIALNNPDSRPELCGGVTVFGLLPPRSLYTFKACGTKITELVAGKNVVLVVACNGAAYEINTRTGSATAVADDKSDVTCAGVFTSTNHERE